MWFCPPISDGAIHWLFIQENIIDVAGYQFNESLRLAKRIMSWSCVNCSVTWLYPSPTLLWSLLNILSPNCSLVPSGEPGNEATLTGQTILCWAGNLCLWKDCMSTSLSLWTYSKLHKPDNDISTLWVWILPCVCSGSSCVNQFQVLQLRSWSAVCVADKYQAADWKKLSLQPGVCSMFMHSVSVWYHVVIYWLRVTHVLAVLTQWSQKSEVNIASWCTYWLIKVTYI